MNRALARLALAASIIVIHSCSTTKEAQLEAVARDWCMTIRASQVIPVYPLTQDIQPGDVFLVQVPVDKQQQQYKQKGFLPLDNHVARLEPTGYSQFYTSSFLSKPGEGAFRLPTDWMRPSAVAGQAAPPWSMAPAAAFPTYSFSVNSSTGLNLAIPISGVPIGLSLLGSKSANGSVTIDDAHTIGIDIVSVEKQLREWADMPDNHEFLTHFGTPSNQPTRNFLRVITRVYLTGKLDVALNDAESYAGGLDVGMPRPVASMLASPPAGPEDVQRSAKENYETTLAKLNAMLAESNSPVSSSAGLTSAGTAAEVDARAAEAKKYREDRIKEAKDRLKATTDDEANKEALAAEKKAKEELDKAKRELDAAQATLNRTREAGLPIADAQAKYDKAKADYDAKLDAYNKVAPPAAAAAAKTDLAQQSLDKLQEFVPGGSLRFTAASSRSLAMSETFNPALVIGYLAFDIAIHDGGHLGEPIPTHAVIEGRFTPEPGSQADIYNAIIEPTVFKDLYKSIQKDRNKTARSIRTSMDGLVHFIPHDLSPLNEEESGLSTHADKPFSRDGFDAYTAFRLERTRAQRLLDRMAGTDTLVIISNGSRRTATYAERIEIRRAFVESLKEQQAYQSVQDAILDYYRFGRR